MPPRWIVAVVVAGWLATLGWLVAEKWLPWWRSAEPPAFAVDLADEVAPQQATWVLTRQGKKAGTAETRMAPRKDGTFELTTRLRDLNLSRGFVDVKMPAFATTQIVNRDGDLLTLDARTTMQIKVFGFDLRIDMTIRGRVGGDEFHGECDFDAGDGKTTEPLDPVKLVSKNAFSPLQPLQKYPPLRPGQTWRVANVDPVSDALSAALRQVVSKKYGIVVPPQEQPRELLAQVQSGTEDVTHRDRAYTCWVIVFQADRVTAKTWVDVADGKVVRQEASGLGETITLQRD